MSVKKSLKGKLQILHKTSKSSTKDFSIHRASQFKTLQRNCRDLFVIKFPSCSSIQKHSKSIQKLHQNFKFPKPWLKENEKPAAITCRSCDLFLQSCVDFHNLKLPVLVLRLFANSKLSKVLPVVSCSACSSPCCQHMSSTGLISLIMCRNFYCTNKSVESDEQKILLFMARVQNGKVRESF